MGRKDWLKQLSDALADAGWRSKQGANRHVRWFCPCGESIIVLSHSPGRGRASRNSRANVRRVTCPCRPADI